ncbi:hypothetical protein GCM10023067_24890 [Aminobacter aganoensis]
MHAAALQPELDIVEGDDAGKFLADVLDFEKVAGVHRGTACGRRFHRACAIHGDRSSQTRPGDMRGAQSFRGNAPPSSDGAFRGSYQFLEVN